MTPIRLTISRNPDLKGCANEWTASAPWFLPGIGRTRVEAKGSFFGANLDRFRVLSVTDIDPESTMPSLTWESYNR